MKKRALTYKLAELFPKDGALSPESEKKRLEDNEAEVEDMLEKFVTTLGRELTEDEKTDLLEIVDEYTPKQEDGNYLTDLIPFDYAWKIYQAKKEEQLKQYTVHIPERE